MNIRNATKYLVKLAGQKRRRAEIETLIARELDPDDPYTSHDDHEGATEK